MWKKRMQSVRPANAVVVRAHKLEDFMPSEKQSAIFLKVGRIFARAQTNRTSHPGLIEKLTLFYETISLEEFTEAFISCLKVPLKVMEKNQSVDRTFDFVANFCIALNKREDENDTGDMCPFVVNVMHFLLDNSTADTPSIRFRICQLINLIMSNLGQNFELDESFADKITVAMLTRLKDKAAVVRVQAVVALQRLQEPTNPCCKVIDKLLFHLECDPSPEVRSAVLGCIARSQHTIPKIYERHLDQRDAVRRNAFLVFAKINIKSLKITYRENLINCGLRDPSPMVKDCATALLLPSWFSCVDKDYIMFLNCLDVSTNPSSTSTSRLALLSLINNEPLEEVLGYMNKLLRAKVIPLKNLWSQEKEYAAEKVFFWTTLVQYLREQGLEESVEGIVPDLTPLCQYIKDLVLEGSPPEEVDAYYATRRTFVVRQLLQLAGSFDLSDEMGRSTLHCLVEQMIVSRNVCNSVTADLVELLVKLEPNVNSRLQKLAELISDIHVPLSPASQVMPVKEADFKELMMQKAKLRMQHMEKSAQQETAIDLGDFLYADTLKADLAEVQARLQQVNNALSTCDREGVRRESNDPATLVQCLTIVYEMMQSPSVVSFTPQLRSLMQDFVDRYMESEPDQQVQALCLQCIGVFSLLDVNVAKERIGVFFMQIADEEEAVISLKCIFDLFLVYGLETFGLEDMIDIYSNIKGGVMEVASSHNSNSSFATSAAIGVLQTLVNILNDPECRLLHPVAAEGFSKLLLAGRINSYRLISRLVLAWYDPDQTDPYMKDTISCFFMAYTSNVERGIPLMADSFLPTMDLLLGSNADSSYADISVANVASLIISLTKPGINPDFSKNVHDDLAVTICERIKSDPSSELTTYLAQALTRLELTLKTADQLDKVLALAKQVKESVAADKAAQKSLIKFISTLEAIDIDRTEVDTTSTAVADATSMLESINLADASTSTQISRPSTQRTRSQAPALTNITETIAEEMEDSPAISISSSPDRKKMRRTLRENVVVSETSDDSHESEEENGMY